MSATGTALGQEINIQGLIPNASQNVPSGSTTVSVLNNTYFGSRSMCNGSITHTFQIYNGDSAPLSLTGSPLVLLSGSPDFSVSMPPFKTTIPAWDTTAFSITYTPTMIGTQTATVSIANNDADENPYTFVISGIGINTPTWDYLGTAGFSAGSADNQSLAIHPITHEPYIAYGDNTAGGRITVMRFDGSNWVTVGGTGFSPWAVQETSLAFHPTTYEPYVAFANGGGVVMRFDGTNWVSLQTGGIGFGVAEHIELDFHPITHEPYVGFIDAIASVSERAVVYRFSGGFFQNLGGNTSGAANVDYSCFAISPTTGEVYSAFRDAGLGNFVMRWDGSGWVNVGGVTVSAGDANRLDLKCSPTTGEPYLAYRDETQGNRITVKRFNGTNWVTVGTEGFSSSTAVAYPSLAFDPISGDPYVAYSDLSNGSRATVLRFDGTNWVSVSASSGFSAGAIDYPCLAFSPIGEGFLGFQDQSVADKSSVMTLNPEIQISGNGIEIVSGSTTTSVANNTDFGYLADCIALGTLSETFTIENVGGSTLELTGSPYVSLSGTDAAHFSVSTQPSGGVVTACSGGESFTITYQPTGAGIHHAIVTVSNSDSNEGSYTFAIRGRAGTPTLFGNGLQANTVSKLAGSDGAAGNINGTGAAARFNFPQGMVIGNDGAIYVADAVNAKVRKVTMAGVVSDFSTLAGSLGEIVKDNNGDFFVADAHRIVKISGTTGAILQTIGSTTPGSSDGDFTTARFNTVYGLALHPVTDELYFSDRSNHKIRKANFTSNTVTTVVGSSVGFADGIGTAARFNQPHGIEFDASGDFLYIADRYNHRIRRLNLNTSEVTTVAGSLSGFVDGAASSARFNQPVGIKFDNFGNLYIADVQNHRVRKLSGSTVSTFVGSSAGFTNGAAATARLTFPHSLLFVGNDVYVGEAHNIRKIETTIVNGTLTPFSAACGAPSAAREMQILASSLSSNLTLTAPTGFEVSLNPTSGFASSLSLAPTSGTVNTTVYVRMNNSYTNVSGSIVASSNCGSDSLAVSGTLTNLPNAPTFTGTTTICSGNTTVLNATDLLPSATVRWYDAPTGGDAFANGRNLYYACTFSKHNLLCRAGRCGRLYFYKNSYCPYG